VRCRICYGFGQGSQDADEEKQKPISGADRKVDDKQDKTFNAELTQAKARIQALEAEIETLKTQKASGDEQYVLVSFCVGAVICRVGQATSSLEWMEGWTSHGCSFVVYGSTRVSSFVWSWFRRAVCRGSESLVAEANRLRIENKAFIRARDRWDAEKRALMSQLEVLQSRGVVASVAPVSSPVAAVVEPPRSDSPPPPPPNLKPPKTVRRASIADAHIPVFPSTSANADEPAGDRASSSSSDPDRSRVDSPPLQLPTKPALVVSPTGSKPGPPPPPPKKPTAPALPTPTDGVAKPMLPPLPPMPPTKADTAKADAAKAEQERLAQEKKEAEAQAERDRLEQENATREAAEAEERRLAAEAELRRLAAEAEERRVAAERAEQERRAREQAAAAAAAVAAAAQAASADAAAAAEAATAAAVAARAVAVAGAASSSAPVPSAWVQSSTDDGTVYYYNSETGESSWERPAAMDAPVASQLAEGWAECNTDDGTIYYYNASSGESSWEKPLAPAGSSSGQGQAEREQAAQQAEAHAENLRQAAATAAATAAAAGAAAVAAATAAVAAPVAGVAAVVSPKVRGPPGRGIPSGKKP
jgi:hypothetical protein